LGQSCTRACRFCAVEHARAGDIVDALEPGRLASAVKRLGLSYVVITSVDRDDLPDGGAGHYAACVRALKRELPGVPVEVIIPDFAGRLDQLGMVMAAGPAVIAHNVEAVERLTPKVRDHRAGYHQSLGVLGYIKMMAPWTITKSSLLLGLGESLDEARKAIADIRKAGVDVLTLGQYLRPGPEQVPVARYVAPEEFDGLAAYARSLGFGCVAAGPFVRTSYHAADNYALVTGGTKGDHGR
ncbi:MAG TPA: lipoyl synthase, partial [Methanocella sp.]|nr:lipoyl synthase [Methanocella sp.]